MQPMESQIGEHRAAVLIGLSTAELRSLAREAEVGRPGEKNNEMVFTYEELRRLCLLAAASHL